MLGGGGGGREGGGEGRKGGGREGERGGRGEGGRNSQYILHLTQVQVTYKTMYFSLYQMTP